ncbi:hypothetical protein FGO68_gene16325 [Halteria grandinella]|uniref:superoxide dismutase n=1 Tax=Halteria grandinella TaxID=5974 RepID=A0A8J8NXG0_HALGN|nr:hypothetical protein FGO68_gene16325 [Halteria grandinella]
MKRYLTPETLATKDLSGLFPGDSLKLHTHQIQGRAIEEIERNFEEDEDLQKESLIEAQQTAGFHEIELRNAIGAHFNHMFLWSILDAPGAIEGKEPVGKLKELVDKHFSGYEGLRESFAKAVNQRVLPGWVWLGFIPANGQLVITQTNNEDNTLMHGIALVQCVPIIGIDLWEHAYFSQFGGDKNAYLERFWAHVNWGKVSHRFEATILPTGKPAPIHPEELI